MIGKTRFYARWLDTPRRSAVVLSTSFFLVACLLVVAYQVWGPSLIDDAYNGRSWIFLNRLFEEMGEIYSFLYYSAAVERVTFFLLAAAIYGMFAVLLVFRFRTSELKSSPDKALIAGHDSSKKLRPSPLAIDTYVISGIMLLTLMFRFPALRLGLWRDEASTYFESLPNTVGEVITTIIYSELNPPEFYLIMHRWVDWFGGDEIVFKVPALAFGLLLIPTCYALGKEAESRSAGLIAAGLVAIAPTAMYYSQEARPYTLAALLSGIVVIFYLKSLRTQHQRWYLLGFVISATLLLYAHYTGLMLVGTLAVITFVLLLRRVGYVSIVPFFVAFGAIFVLFLPWIQIFFTHLVTGTPWSSKGPWTDLPITLIKSIGFTLPWEREKWSSSLIALLILIAIAASFWRLRPRAQGRAQNIAPADVSSEAKAAIVGAAFLGPALILASLSYTDRYIFPFLPIASGLYGIWLSRIGGYLPERMRIYRLPGSLLFLYGWAIFNSWNYATVDSIPKSGIRTLALETTDAQNKDTVYFLSPDYLGVTFGYYFEGRDVEFYGFARLDDPHIFSPYGYAEIWSRQDAVANAEKRIQSMVDKGYPRMALIQDNCKGPLRDRGKMQYSRGNDLRSKIDNTYFLLSEKVYPGKKECVTVSLFDLTKIIDRP